MGLAAAPYAIAARLGMGLALAAVLAIGAPLAAGAADVTVFAAASMKGALDDIAADWTKTTGKTVALSYDGSAKLAKQIEAGAPADIFISAAPEWMDLLEKDGLIRPESRRDIVSNTLVLIAHDPKAAQIALTPGLDLGALLQGGKLAMGMVNAVPAGQYGKAALETLGLWEQVKPAVVEAENVRAALALVARGEAAFGIVYGSDATGVTGVTVISTFPETSHQKILYPAALIGKDPSADVAALLDNLSSASAQAIFAKRGFLPLPPSAGE